MLKKFKQLSVTLIAALTLSVPMLIPAMAHAAPTSPPPPPVTPPASTTINGSLCDGVASATGDATAAGTGCTSGGSNTDLTNIVSRVINIFSLIVGAVSVIMIIFGGFKYITSGGNDSNVSGAKNTILYAVIGLVIVALAQIIVRFVLTKATGA
jgi:hypothetical protein